jgi:hypothetical protein
MATKQKQPLSPSIQRGIEVLKDCERLGKAINAEIRKRKAHRAMFKVVK